MDPHVWPHSSGQYSRGLLAAVAQQAVATVASKLSGTQPRLYQSLYALKEFAAHLLDLHSPGMEHGFEILTLTNLDKRGEIFSLMK